MMDHDREIVLERQVADTGLSFRILNACANHGVETIADLCCQTESQLLLWPNFGQTSLNEVKELLVGLGLRLGMDFLRRRPALIKGLNDRDVRLLENFTIGLCLRSVRDQVEASLAMQRATHFNRDENFEHHRAVVIARFDELDYIARSWALDRGCEVR